MYMSFTGLLVEFEVMLLFYTIIYLSFELFIWHGVMALLTLILRINVTRDINFLFQVRNVTKIVICPRTILYSYWNLIYSIYSIWVIYSLCLRAVFLQDLSRTNLVSDRWLNLSFPLNSHYMHCLMTNPW